MTTIMKTIIKNENYTIISHPNNIYIIEFAHPSEILIKSLLKTRIITGATATDDYKILKFKASEVKTFEQYKKEQTIIHGTPQLKMYKAAQLIQNLSRQLEYIIKSYYHTFIGYNTENLIVIDGKTFAFLGCDLLYEIDHHTNSILISKPFSLKDFFVSPELKMIREIPSHIHYKTSYFSMAYLILYSLAPDDEIFTTQPLQQYLDSLPFKGTKLYWFLSRCLVEEPQNRTFVFM